MNGKTFVNINLLVGMFSSFLCGLALLVSFTRNVNTGVFMLLVVCVGVMSFAFYYRKQSKIVEQKLKEIDV